MRFPAQIGNWEINESLYNVKDLLGLIELSIKDSLDKSTNPGVLLSGGIDSSILALLVQKFANVPYFTIGSSLSHPDVIAASKLAKEFDLKLFIYIPSRRDVILSSGLVKTNFPGDEIVYLALQFASHFVTDILAADGIDEQMGGYWWHINKSFKCPTVESAFKHFWDKLESDHLTPMFESAKQANVNVRWVYLYPEIVNYINRIPLDDRVKDGESKAVWKQLARSIGVPEWVIIRKKKGFVDALDTNF